MSTSTADTDTKDWIRNTSDEKAVANGSRFDGERGQFVVDWLRDYLRLYEGDFAGQPFECRDWQLEATMRIFGWVKWSDRHEKWVRRFRRASIFVPKKSKKSPSMAAWGLYLLAGDGEPGQKIYLAAKDGSQAREIVGRHAIEMAQASDALMGECSINRSSMQITHEPTRSIMKPISSHDARSQKSKEGLNGSILVDETHVVDRAFMNRVSRAGISRKEPLQIEVSTAGDDPLSYGRTQFDYGREVERGERDDEEFFSLIYSAPQDLTDAQLAADPVKYGIEANPSWGHTIHEPEFLADYARSSVSLSDLAEFKMYRLNVWLAASNPAIRPEDWNACAKTFDASELLGKRCYAGLDLALKWDTSALVLWFPWDEVDGERTFRLLVKFWLPEDTAEKQRREVRWHDWAQRREIELTGGNITDFPLIHREIAQASKDYQLVQLNYDERFAQAFCQRLQDEDKINCKPFLQSAPSYNEPCRLFETLVVDGRIEHQANQCMGWQVSQLTFKDVNGLKIPAKPKNNPLARIDGPSAAIMSLATAIEDPMPPKSIYEKRGVLTLDHTDISGTKRAPFTTWR